MPQLIGQLWNRPRGKFGYHHFLALEITYLFFASASISITWDLLCKCHVIVEVFNEVILKACHMVQVGRPTQVSYFLDPTGLGWEGGI